MGMEQFYTRGASNDGVKLPLVTPTGEKTEHYIMIHGVDSDVFRIADSDSKRASMRIAALPENERDEALRAAKRRLVAALIFAWSFDQDPTAENVEAFLVEAPQVADTVDRVAGNRALFFALRSASSNDLPKPSSGSKKSRKARPAP